MGCQPMLMEFRLLVNVELLDPVCRDQPSGTFSKRWPAGAGYVT
jgi:hypothetical protein